MVWEGNAARLAGKAIWILLVILASPVCVSASPVGVVTGDWWRYGSLGFGFYSDNPEATIPPEMMDTGLAWYRLAVTDISDTNVALDMTVGFQNGTEVGMKAGGDLATGTGNQTFFIFPAGLSKGDTMPTGVYVNDTITRSYAGSTREVNVVNGTRNLMGTQISNCIIFDKITGIMCEYSMEVTTKQGDWTTTVSSMMELTESNAFRSTPIPELGVAGAGLVSALLLVPFLRRRKTANAAQASDPADPETPGVSGLLV